MLDLKFCLLGTFQVPLADYLKSSKRDTPSFTHLLGYFILMLFYLGMHPMYPLSKLKCFS